MRKEKLLLKLTGIMAIAIIAFATAFMATSCTPKKSAEQIAMEARLAELQAQLNALAEEEEEEVSEVAQAEEKAFQAAIASGKTAEQAEKEAEKAAIDKIVSDTGVTPEEAAEEVTRQRRARSERQQRQRRQAERAAELQAELEEAETELAVVEEQSGRRGSGSGSGRTSGGERSGSGSGRTGGRNQKAEPVADGPAIAPPATLVAEGFEYFEGAIVKYVGNETRVSIPATLNDQPITAIGAKAFADNTSLQTVVISDSITTIGQQAFSGCTNLTVVYLWGEMKTIHQNAFLGDLRDKYLDAKQNRRQGILFGASAPVTNDSEWLESSIDK